MKKNFEITVSLEDGILFIGEETSTGVNSNVESNEDIIRCIDNYLEIYVEEK